MCPDKDLEGRSELGELSSESGLCADCDCCLRKPDIKDCNCIARRVLALNVRRLRARRNLSQEELSDLANIHRTHLARLESQAINISVVVLFRIARALQVDPRELLKPRNY
jgi:DNA-binding Xre family transcriptional regulator